MSRHRRHVALVLAGSVAGERTVTALELAERLCVRGCRVTVFAHGEAATLAARGGELAPAVEAMVARGVRDGGFGWITDTDAATRRGVAEAQVPGVVGGDPADLWALVRDADVVLSPGSPRAGAGGPS